MIEKVSKEIGNLLFEKRIEIYSSKS